MTYYGSKQLAEAFRTVRNNTIKVAEDIPEDKYEFRAAPECRTVAQILVHLATGPRMAEQIHGKERRRSMEGFDFFAAVKGLQEEEAKPRTKAEIVSLLRKEGERTAQWIEAMPEEALAETVAFPAGMTPPARSRFEMLMGLKEHEMHHRGQLMLIERMVGVVPHLTRQMQERIAQMQAQQKQQAAQGSAAR